MKCFSSCVDTTKDSANCGGCGKACGTGETCASSVCGCGTTGKACLPTEDCVAGACKCKLTMCGSVCTDPLTDALHCGGCGKPCSSGVPCIGGVCVSSTTVSFPTSGSVMSSGGTLGSGGGGAYYISGAYVEEKFSRTAPISRLDVDFKMSDSTSSYCSVGTLTWAVKLNGTTVGTYSWAGGTSGGDKTIKQSYTFSPLSMSGTVAIRFEATTTVCPGGGSWNWYPGGTATLY